MATDARTEQAIVRKFQEMRQHLSELASKINELQGEVGEHEVVIKSLEPMDGGRKCFRLIDSILVERTVAEVLPAVKQNRDKLQAVIESMKQQAIAAEKELQEFQAKYKIRVVRNEGDIPEGATPASRPQGMLAS